MRIEYPVLDFKPHVTSLRVAEPITAHYEIMDGCVLSFVIVLTKFFNVEVIDQMDGTKTVINGGLDEAMKYAQAKFQYDINQILARCGVKED
jgi:hypothetical protein